MKTYRQLLEEVAALESRSERTTPPLTEPTKDPFGSFGSAPPARSQNETTTEEDTAPRSPVAIATPKPFQQPEPKTFSCTVCNRFAFHQPRRCYWCRTRAESKPEEVAA